MERWAGVWASDAQQRIWKLNTQVPLESWCVSVLTTVSVLTVLIFLPAAVSRSCGQAAGLTMSGPAQGTLGTQALARLQGSDAVLQQALSLS